jgi:hypothetical protein
LSHKQPHLIPYAVTHIAFKYCGYSLGFHGHALPRWLNQYLSAQSYFWSSPRQRPESPAVRAELGKVT